ncbi:MotA/TolQ/ExbB proton channel family protein [Rheinheimera aquimaris]|uniref:MotA/TolQ/ExbB proton channel family protein n=1 Tax=Rheinheimera aquimaris TaxID=412437 RepID=UPI001066906D|nr:MotA/TolQ/ExbB proton channel family protein [Rheinheimera aquimaris]
MLTIETVLYELSYWFMIPVLVSIILFFLYSLYAAGRFLTECYQQFSTGSQPLHTLMANQPHWKTEELELAIMRELEGLKITARTAPLLGLVATMIPMGPALAGVAAGEMTVVGEQVGVAFAAVIVALVAASLAFIIQTVTRRWRLKELLQLERQQQAAGNTP